MRVLGLADGRHRYLGRPRAVSAHEGRHSILLGQTPKDLDLLAKSKSSAGLALKGGGRFIARPKTSAPPRVVDFALARSRRHARTRRDDGGRLHDGICLADKLHRFIAVKILNFATSSVGATTTHPAAHMTIGSFRRGI